MRSAKACTTCGTVKPLAEFYRIKKPRWRETHHERCEDCERSRSRAYSHKHRERHAQTRRPRRDEWMEREGPCRDCGTWEQLEVHHVDPSQKEPMRLWCVSRNRRERELAKCIPLCQACHHRRHGRSAPGTLNHGTLTAYNKKKCRCTKCAEFVRLYMREYRQKQKLLNPS